MLNAGRMLLDTSTVDGFAVLATLDADFTYYRMDGSSIRIPEGTTFHVDENRNIGYLNGDYFQVDSGDYTVSYLN